MSVEPNLENSVKVSAITKATKRGHIMRDVQESEPFAPGVFAVCVECKCTLRWYHGSMRGEGSLTWCPEAPTSVPDVTIMSEEESLELSDRLGQYATATLNDWGHIINEWAESKGWNEKLSADHFDGLLALAHSELSEALEEWRNGYDITAIYYVEDKHGNDKPEGVPIELADCIIRLLHTMTYFGIDINQAMRIKHEYNITREYRHGGKRS